MQTISKGPDSILKMLENDGIDHTKYIHFYSLWQHAIFD